MNWALALATAVLLALVAPGFDYAFLAPVALTPLLVAVHREFGWRMRFLQGWACGIVYWFAVCYWIQAVLAKEGGLGAAGGWGAFLLFALAKGLHVAVFAALAGAVVRKWYTLPALAALWVGIERTNGTFGFAWFTLGNAGIDMSVPMRLAPITGVYGLSFCFAMMGAGFALSIQRRPRHEVLALLALPLLFLLPKVEPAAPGREQAVYVQPNIPPDLEWTAEQRRAVNQRLLALSHAAAMRAGDPAPRLVLWPETPAPLYFFEDDALREAVVNLAAKAQTHVVTGVVGRTPEGPTNSAVVVAPNGKVLDRYDKIRLVPFGEFVPPLFGFVNKISAEAGDYRAGSRVVTFATGAGKTGLFICYESVFPELIRQFVFDGATVLVNLSNDGYFGHSAARRQHLKIARMRAAENHRWILRATNDGITATIDPSGRITHAIDPYIATSVRTTFAYERDITPYTRWGDWFAWGSLLVGLAAAVAGQFPHYRRPGT